MPEIKLSLDDVDAMSNIVYGMTAKYYMNKPGADAINPTDLYIFSEATLRMCLSNLDKETIDDPGCNEHQRKVHSAVRKHFLNR